MRYKCNWPNCGEEFESDPGQSGMGKKCVGDQVKCPACKNFLPNKAGR